MSKKYKLTYRLYSNDYSHIPEECEVVVDDPWGFIHRLEADLSMVHSDLHLGSYVIEPVNHLRLVKND
jgi:hypothetical protein